MYDPSVKVLEVDFTSVESLTSALHAQDAVVSTVSATAVEGQRVLIDAAVLAGVKRFIPSDFGSCTTSPKVKKLPVYAPMAGIQQYLADKVKTTELSFTVLACGAFLDIVLSAPVLLDFDSYRAVLIDDGNNRLSSTSMASIGRAISGILKNHQTTSNRTVRVSQVILTQNKLLDIAKEIKPEVTWDISTVTAAAMLQESLEEFASGDVGMPVIIKLLKATAFGGEQYGSAYDETDNEILDIATVTESELKKLVAERLS